MPLDGDKSPYFVPWPLPVRTFRLFHLSPQSLQKPLKIHENPLPERAHSTGTKFVPLFFSFVPARKGGVGGEAAMGAGPRGFRAENGQGTNLSPGTNQRGQIDKTGTKSGDNFIKRGQILSPDKKPPKKNKGRQNALLSHRLVSDAHILKECGRRIEVLSGYDYQPFLIPVP